ncbi:related to Carboxypeptidase S [Saccharomycodes ludwigii]|uniref:Related to Carboxypeptidase S n=1 Tax=Saccharomycodes ludwigii TaxID=36035 RepID=A0A376B8G0_9ASCO|nr:related to Carboxypeptidase S [Saccharomycodes ludwigii]
MTASSSYLPISVPGPSRKKNYLKKIRGLLLVVVVFASIFSIFIKDTSKKNNLIPAFNDCGLYSPIVPTFKKSFDQILYDKKYKLTVVDKLTNAVRIPTQIYDETPPPDLKSNLTTDPNWANFTKFHDFLQDSFPHVFKTLKVEKINGLGLLLTWSSETTASAPPLLLMAHQDVVPVEPSTISKWTHPPFEGIYDPEKDLIYGRGSSDTKQMIISEMEAIEKLIIDGFEPTKRPLLIAYGFDEEASGTYGAAQISQVLLERYGKNGLYGIIDEGDGVEQMENDGDFVAVIPTSEKGYLDAVLILNTKGGHSSIPPDHTSIGIMSELNMLIEESPYEQVITLDNPALEMLQCISTYSDSPNDKALKNAFKDGRVSKIGKIVDNIPNYKFLFKTSQALDLMYGGVKSNALPEQVTVLLNHRIGIHSTVNETLSHVLKNVLLIAKKYDFSVNVEHKNGTHISAPRKEGSNGEFVVQLMDPLEPATISPTGDDELWNIIAGTVVNTYQQPLFQEKKKNGTDNKVLVTSSLMAGNTDTKSYWDLTNRIYRFRGSLTSAGDKNEHTVDETTGGLTLMSGVAFFYQLITNVDRLST